MSEFEFAVGTVVRHRVGGAWRGVVYTKGGEIGGVVDYVVRYYDGARWRVEDFYEWELIAEEPEPPPFAFAPVQVAPAGPRWEFNWAENQWQAATS